MPHTLVGREVQEQIRLHKSQWQDTRRENLNHIITMQLVSQTSLPHTHDKQMGWIHQ